VIETINQSDLHRFKIHPLYKLILLLLIMRTSFSCVDGDLVNPDPEAPIITSFVPESGAPGSEVNIFGENFNGTPGKDSVYLNGYGAEIISSSSTQIGLIVPDSATTGPITVKELVTHKRGISSSDYEVIASEDFPEIYKLKPTSGVVGTSFQILGANFGENIDAVTVRIGPDTTIVNSVIDSIIVTSVPVGATTGPVTVSIDSITAVGPEFTVLDEEPPAPVITSIDPVSGKVGATVTIKGENFSDIPSENTVTFNEAEAVVNSATSTVLVVVVPDDATTGLIFVTVGGLTSNGFNFSVESTPPQISSINPTSGPFDTKVSITGTNFSEVMAENTVMFNGNEAITTSASATQLIAIVPRGAGTGPVSVTTNGLTAMGPLFTYIKTALVNTYAGNGNAGFVDGPATTAEFNGASRMDVNSSGEIFMADFTNHSIRKINTKNEVSTFSGDGSSGFVNGAVSGAKYNQPFGVAIDDDGNMYIADASNHVIRKISTSNVVSTYAGNGQAGFSDGQADVAAFNGPSDVAVDSDGNVYVADLNNHAIRKIDKNGNVSTIAGNGTAGFTDSKGSAARFYLPSGLGIDNQNNVYVADLANHAIRRVDIGGNVTTVAGNGTAGSADGSLAAARFNFPYDVDLDELGNLYIADGKNHKIRIITTSNTVETLAGSGTEGFLDGIAGDAMFNDPTGIKVINSERIYVGDTENNRVRVISFE